MREAIKHEIKSLLSNKDNPVCILLKGNWGVGKTHLWKEIEKELKEKNNEKTLTAYVSLFGKENITQIEQEVKTQIYTILKIKEKFKNMDININIGVISISGILSIFDKEIKKVIICFDDFERHSKNLEFKDILGEISVLKENNNCNILMIMNESELESNNQDGKSDANGTRQPKKDKEIFDEYKEKIVDYEFAYEPTPKDSFEMIKGSFGNFKKIASEYFEPLFTMKTNNIRTMKKIANVVTHISKHITNFNELQYEIKKDFFNTISDIVTDYAENLHKHTSFNPNFLNRFENKRGKYALYFSSGFDAFIKYYLENNAIITNLDNEIQIAMDNYNKIQNNNELKKLNHDFKNFYNRFIYQYQYDFKKTDEEYSKEILDFLNNDNFTQVIKDYSVAIFLIKRLNELNNNKKENHELGLTLMKQYIEIYKSNSDKELLEDIIKFDKDNLEQFYEDIMKKDEEILNLDNSEKLCEYLELNNYDNFTNLRFVENEKLKKFFLQDVDCTKKCIKLSLDDGMEKLDTFRNKILDVLQDIARDEKLEKFQQNKAKKIIENFSNNDKVNEKMRKKAKDILEASQNTK